MPDKRVGYGAEEAAAGWDFITRRQTVVGGHAFKAGALAFCDAVRAALAAELARDHLARGLEVRAELDVIYQGVDGFTDIKCRLLAKV